MVMILHSLSLLGSCTGHLNSSYFPAPSLPRLLGSLIRPLVPFRPSLIMPCVCAFPYLNERYYASGLFYAVLSFPPASVFTVSICVLSCPGHLSLTWSW